MKHRRSIYNINSKTVNFQRLNNSQSLAGLLHFEFNSFKRVIENASYSEFNIPKKTGGVRRIESPNEYLSLIQKQLNECLQAVYYKIKPTHVYGFIQSVKGEETTCTIISNAQNHIGKDYVLNIDLKDYFHSITATQVRDFFQSSRFNFSEDLATCIALICCWKGRLPMGASTSPVLANLLSLKLDEQLIALASYYNLTYTRYADDLTFSANDKISDEVIHKIKALIVGCEFKINKKKVRMQSKFSQQTVTGIKVNKKLNVDRRYIRNIRAILHDIKLNGIEKATMKHFKTLLVDEKLINTFVLKIKGKIDFVGQVRGKEDLIYTKFRQIFCANYF